jgi:hypothetical protein
MENIDELHRHATDALSSRLRTNTVAIVNSRVLVTLDRDRAERSEYFYNPGRSSLHVQRGA